MTLSSANNLTAKQLRDGLGSVFLLGLTPGSPARTIAQQAAGNASSYLRGKDAFNSAFQALLALPGFNSGGQLALSSTQGSPTQAGSIVAEWQKARADRTTLFDETGATGPTSSWCRSTALTQRPFGSRTSTATLASCRARREQAFCSSKRRRAPIRIKSLTQRTGPF